MAVGDARRVWAGCSACPLAASAAAEPPPGLVAAALVCFGAPLAFLLLSAGLAAALVPDRPELALLGLLSLPGVAIAVRRRLAFGQANTQTIYRSSL